MANTVIQLKYSTVTTTPPSLNVAEPAYSYASNTFFIGNPTGDGVLAIGGKFYVDQQALIFTHANAAYAKANTTDASSGVYANSAFTAANSAGVYANSAFSAANSAGVYANSAFAAANAATATDATQNTNISSAASYANSAFLAANTPSHVANSAASYANSAFLAANTPSYIANSAASYANSAFARANNSINANTGGTITADLTVTGNLTVQGTTTYVNTQTLTAGDSLIHLANNNTVGDTVDIGFYGSYNPGGGTKYTGLVRQAGANFFLFKGLDTDPTANTLAPGSLTAANTGTLTANLTAYSVTINGQDINQFATNAYTQANTGVTNAATADAKAVTAGSYANSAYSQANTATTNAATADSKAVSAGSYANSAYTQANTATTNAATADSKAVSAGSYANSAFDKANTTYTLATGTAGVANTDYTTISTTAGYYGNGATISSFTLEANGRISQANSTLIGIAATQVTTGTLAVARGGTGTGSHTVNGVLLGQGTSAVTTASSSTEGHVLTINASGVPTFAFLQGGTF